MLITRNNLYEWSVEEFVVDKSVFRDIPFDKEANKEHEHLFEDESHKEGHVNILEGYVKYVNEVDKVKQQNPFVTGHNYLWKIMTKVFKKHWEFTNGFCIDWAVSDFL